VLAERVKPLTLARDRQLPVHPALARLLPDGLQRGIAVAVTADASGGATTLALALASGVSGAGGWVAAVGMPGLGLAASDSLGVSLERLVLVDCRPVLTAQVVASLVDGFALILVGAGMLAARDGRRLAARLREQGAVLVIVGGGLADATTLRLAASTRWDHAADVGPGRQVPLLTRRVLTVTATGRGAYGAERHDELLMDAEVFGPGGLRVESLGPVPVELRKVSG
jgi:hypothetical protein